MYSILFFYSLELETKHKKVQERTREIEEKLQNQTLEIGSTGKMKFLDQQIDVSYTFIYPYFMEKKKKNDFFFFL
jgi:hypothetical protein